MRPDGRFQGSMPPNLILLPTVTAVVVMLAGCDDTSTQGQQIETFGADQAQYAGICTDLRDRANPDDDVRVDDDLCGEDDEDGNASNPGFSFLWLDLGGGHSQTIPAHGQTVPRGLGSNVHPKGAVVMKKMPSGQWSVGQVKSGVVKPASPIQRGGFGISAGKGSSGG